MEAVLRHVSDTHSHTHENIAKFPTGKLIGKNVSIFITLLSCSMLSQDDSPSFSMISLSLPDGILEFVKFGKRTNLLRTLSRIQCSQVNES
jgi:hypothetical protein